MTNQREKFEITKSIIHKCPAIKLPQSYLQKLGNTAQIIVLKGCDDDTANFIINACNAALSAAPASQNAQQAPDKDAATDVIAERQRQMAVEGWTPEHDDEHTDGSLVEAAIAYAMAAKAEPAERAVIDSFGFEGLTFKIKSAWPNSWRSTWFKPKTPRRDLVRAAALLIAEIERLDRAAIIEGSKQ